jgi:hypothetical protein
MEVLIFGIVGLAVFAIFVGVSAFPAIAAYFIGTKFRTPYVRWIPLAIVVAAPLIWGVASYSAFKDGCKSVPPATFVASPQTKADGFLLSGTHIRWDPLIERGAFRFVEVPLNDTKIRRNFAGEKQYKRSPVPVKTEWVAPSSAKSEYVVNETPAERVEYWWKPPIYKYGLEVREKKSGRLLASATDLVFGGGIAGTYMRAIRGDQDFEYVSCGYASAAIDTWRPSLTSRPRFAEYQDADLKFLLRALSPLPFN